MNYRRYLGTLLKIGCSALPPVKDIANTPDAEIEGLWSQAQGTPYIFYANEKGVLSDRPGPGGCQFSMTRRELYRCARTVFSGKGLVMLIESIPNLKAQIRHLFVDYRQAPRSRPDEKFIWPNWEAWAASGENQSVAATVNDWLEGRADQDDYRDANIKTSFCRSVATLFFTEEPELAVLLGVLVGDGVAEEGFIERLATLTKSCEEANSLAVTHGLPIRFKEWSPVVIHREGGHEVRQTTQAGFRQHV